MTRWVVECGSNHNGDRDRAFALLEAAAAAGFSDFKTQAWTLEKLFAPEALKAKPELLERKRLEMPWEWHKPLANRCKELGMGYGVSAFQAADVKRAAVEADWLKVSSYSLLDTKLLETVASQPKPIVVSTGMATAEEVDSAMYDTEHHRGGRIFLHCVSSYPAPPHEANLRSIPYMRERFGVPVGWSDHTLSGVVLARAKDVFGATMIEVHWDLDDHAGDERAHSWTPGTWRERDLGFVDGGFYQCDGKANRKAPTLSEETERAWRADPSDGLRPLLATRALL